jgi:hypothetical protein
VAVDAGEEGDAPRPHPDRLESPDQPAVPARASVLADPERRAAEYRLYFATVERVFSAARDAWCEAAPKLRETWESIIDQGEVQIFRRDRADSADR